MYCALQNAAACCACGVAGRRLDSGARSNHCGSSVNNNEHRRKHDDDAKSDGRSISCSSACTTTRAHNRHLQAIYSGEPSNLPVRRIYIHGAPIYVRQTFLSPQRRHVGQPAGQPLGRRRLVVSARAKCRRRFRCRTVASASQAFRLSVRCRRRRRRRTANLCWSASA